MAKLIDIGVKIPASVPEGSPLELVYPTAYVVAARAAGGMFEGRAGPLESDGWRRALAKTGSSAMQAYGGEVGDPLPPLVQLRVKPRGAGVKGLDWHIEGHPRDTGGGAWDGSRYGVVGEQMATVQQLQSLSAMLATGAEQQTQTERALADVAQSEAERDQRVQSALDTIGTINTVINGLSLGTTEAGQYGGTLTQFVSSRSAVTTASVQQGENGGLLYDFGGI